MIGAQHVKFRAAPQPRSKRGLCTADLASACSVRPLHPQISLSIQLKLKIVCQRFGARVVSLASPAAIPGAVLVSVWLHRDAEPPAGIFAGLALSSGDHGCPCEEGQGIQARRRRRAPGARKSGAGVQADKGRDCQLAYRLHEGGSGCLAFGAMCKMSVCSA